MNPAEEIRAFTEGVEKARRAYYGDQDKYAKALERSDYFHERYEAKKDKEATE